MIVTFEGVQGSGKSLTSTTLAFAEHENNGVTVFSNTKLNFEYTPFDTKYFVDNIETNQLENAVLLLDEAYLYTDARSGSSKLNKLMTYFIVQTRKRGVDLYICTHHIDVLDKRLRRAVDIRGTCRYRKEKPCTQCEGKGFITAEAGKVIPDRKLGMVLIEGVKHPVVIGTSTSFKGTIEVRVRDLYTNRSIRVPDYSVTPKSKIDSSTWSKLVAGLDLGGPRVPDPDDPDDGHEKCPRCLGWGETGWATTRFLDMRTGVRKRIRVFGPAAYGLYDTKERVPFTKKQMRISAEDL